MISAAAVHAVKLDPTQELISFIFYLRLSSEHFFFHLFASPPAPSIRSLVARAVCCPRTSAVCVHPVSARLLLSGQSNSDKESAFQSKRDEDEDREKNEETSFRIRLLSFVIQNQLFISCIVDIVFSAFLPVLPPHCLYFAGSHIFNPQSTFF